MSLLCINSLVARLFYVLADNYRCFQQSSNLEKGNNTSVILFVV